MNHWLEGALRNYLVILLASSRTLCKLFCKENVSPLQFVNSSRAGKGPGERPSAFWGKKGKRHCGVSIWQGDRFSRLGSSESCIPRSECLVLGSIAQVGEESHWRALLVGKEFCEIREMVPWL